MTITPEQFMRRSFVQSRLVAAGACFRAIGDAALATSFPGATEPPLGLADLSPVPRLGVKGRRALAWLGGRDWSVPVANNAATLASDGYIIGRLADTEALVLGPTHAADGYAPLRGLEAAIPGDGVWTAPRRDSHCWFRLRGAAAVDCLQKLCGVDLREARLPAGSIAQTSVARLNAIVIRDDDHTFHLLADSASAGWFWDTLLDAMAEFGGGPAGA